MQKEMKIKFPESGKIKILQVSDPQDMHIVRSAMIKMLNTVYDKVEPDLVVFTGDNILGNHIDDRLVGSKTQKNPAVTKRRIRKALNHILKPLDKRKVPYCMIYGNHDDKNCLTKQEQADIYKEHEYFVGLNSDEEKLDCDTYNLPIYDSKGEKIKYNLWMLDSAWHDKEKDESYCYVKPQVMEWYQRKSDQLKAQNGGEPVMSLMFQHIPVRETVSLFKECDKADKNAVPVKGEKDKFAKLDTDKANGYAFEYPDVCEVEIGQMDAIREQGDVCAVVFGHDHVNCFTAEIDGVNIIQTPGASFRSYGNMLSRGVRVFEIDENHPDEFSTYIISYFDLFGKKFRSVLRYIMGADEMEKKRNLIWILLGIFGVAFVTYILGSFHLLNF